MNNHLNQKGISLVEVLASIVIISILFSIISSYIVSSYKHSSSISNKYSSVQIAESILEVYKAKDYSELRDLVDNGIETIDIIEVLELDVNTDIGSLIATVNIEQSIEQPDRLLVVQVTVISTENDVQKETELKGFKRNEGIE
ncbi:prepilin-type N-terminal cleavage/methylation domain-containing protein [Bacillus sp. T33-2]|uniref:prepilin-type N-terminal cleavage/methylation domain-containing protein n=1 Tax=Bacillus sp. T33-2 TaxID=2054168 RepID=UPI0015E07186|nr:prepilin-type N-terminal cleavage/methylation domain-containing protein [Bacillus sp. T33-2]